MRGEDELNKAETSQCIGFRLNSSRRENKNEGAFFNLSRTSHTFLNRVKNVFMVKNVGMRDNLTSAVLLSFFF